MRGPDREKFMVFEQLESRRMMSATMVAAQQSGVLYVQGTSSADQIQLLQTGPGSVAISFGPGGSQGVQSFSGVTGIAINASSGDDVLVVTLNDIDISVALGSGNDSIDLTSGGGIIVVDGGNGIDGLDLAVQNASLVVVTGGNQADNIVVNATDTGSGVVPVIFIDGGNGDDAIEFNGFDSSAVIYAGNGNDQISVPLFFSIDGSDTLTILGGNGTDSATVSNINGQVFVASDVEMQSL